MRTLIVTLAMCFFLVPASAEAQFWCAGEACRESEAECEHLRQYQANEGHNLPHCHLNLRLRALWEGSAEEIVEDSAIVGRTYTWTDRTRQGCIAGGARYRAENRRERFHVWNLGECHEVMNPGFTEVLRNQIVSNEAFRERVWSSLSRAQQNEISAELERRADEARTRIRAILNRRRYLRENGYSSEEEYNSAREEEYNARVRDHATGSLHVDPAVEARLLRFPERQTNFSFPFWFCLGLCFVVCGTYWYCHKKLK